MLNKCVIVYLDDILIYFSCLSKHVVHVRQVLRLLLNHGLYANAEKCEFHKIGLAFLGYHIGLQRVGMKEKRCPPCLAGHNLPL